MIKNDSEGKRGTGKEKDVPGRQKNRREPSDVRKGRVRKERLRKKENRKEAGGGYQEGAGDPGDAGGFASAFLRQSGLVRPDRRRLKGNAAGSIRHCGLSVPLLPVFPRMLSL